ncbi:hypothetical protein AUK40_01760 [Candidatus Wirthbacteria bacterium CG2_30_54_11]|uniref:Uncharacterized protein n=1 Tax=Candidatus Wirthbacteria bacterium CG2_30_54_11 TaxID=1817892 RepID=A0A1J5IMM5_9BACT|nr:MAG: hypothetical protein AUK40_01760 [Candidatus Wirthbacteria bacterium CG2_30_54_11]
MTGMTETSISVEKIEQYLELFLEGKRSDLPVLNAEEALMVRTMIESRSSVAPEADFVQALKVQIAVRGKSAAPLPVSAPPAGKPHFIQEFSMAVKDFFKPRFAVVRIGVLGLVVVAIVGGALLYPGIKGGLNKSVLSRKEASAQEILTKLASNIASFQESTDIVHRVDRMTSCMQDYGYYGMWYSRSAMPEANENGYFCTTDTNESWSMGESYMYVSKDEQGEITSISLNHNGWSYSYTGGAKKASKVNWAAVNEAINELSSASGAGGGTMAFKSGSYATESLKSADQAEENASDTMNVQQIQEETLLKLKELYGNVEVLGQETVNGKETYKLQYVYDQAPFDKFGVSANTFNISVGIPASAALNDPTVSPVDGRIMSESGTTTVAEGSAGPGLTVSSGSVSVSTDGASGSVTVSSGDGVVSTGPVSPPDIGIGMPAPYPSSTTTTFWVDTTTFEQVKFEEWMDINSAPQLLYSSEVLTQETISKDRADEVFQFPAPDGVEVVDITEATLEMQRKSMEASHISISGIIDSAAIGLFVPAQLPEGMQLGDLYYNDPSIYMDSALYRDFMPEKAYEEMMTNQFKSEISMNLNYWERDPYAVTICDSSDYTQQRSLTIRLSDQDPFATGYYGELDVMKDDTGTEPDFEVTDETVDINGTSGTLRTTTYEWDPENGNMNLVFKKGDTYIDIAAYAMDASDLLAIARSMVEVASADSSEGIELQAAADRQAERWNQPWVPVVPEFRSIAQQSSVHYYVPEHLPEGVVLNGAYCLDYAQLSLNYGTTGDMLYSGRAEITDQTVSYAYVSVVVSADEQLSYGKYGMPVDDMDSISSPMEEPSYEDPYADTTEREVTVQGQTATLTVTTYTYGGDPQLALSYQDGREYINLSGSGMTEEEFLLVAGSLTRIEPDDTAAFDRLEEQIREFNEQIYAPMPL